MITDKQKINSCLLIFESRRADDFERLGSLVGSFNSRGYGFAKVALIAYDDSEEIVRAVNDCLNGYDNLIIFCPSRMEKTLKDYISSVKGTAFDGTGQLNCDKSSVFILLSDGECFLTPSKIADKLDEKYGVHYQRAFIKTVGAPKSAVTEAIEEACSLCGGLGFNVSDSYGDGRIEIVYSDVTPKSAFDSAYRALLTKLNDYVYAIEDISLAKRLYELLKLRRMKISVAESFTGGGVCKSLVGVAGVSEVFDEGLNTYSNEAKMRRLGVNEETLRAYGAVSEEVAAQMAEGLISVGVCDVAVSTTGIAGPASDNTRKPVGLIYIGVAVKEKTSVYKYNLKGGRDTITRTAINLALYHAFKTIK